MFDLFPKKPKTHARGIANAALKMAAAAVSRDDLEVTKRHIRPERSGWTIAFGAINTYAILSNVQRSIANTDRKDILLDIIEEFHKRGFTEIFQEFMNLQQLLRNMQITGPPYDSTLLGLWAMEKTGYGCKEYPRQQGDEVMLKILGEELFAYLGSVAAVIIAADDAGELNWQR